MKRLIALALVALASVTVTTFAGEPVASSKEVAPPPLPPQSYFRANEWSLGAFATYGWTYNHNERGISNHYWGGGVDGQYFPLQYLGFAIEGDFFNEIPGDRFGSTVFGNVIARYPLDLIFPNVHLAPYGFAGIGGLFDSEHGFSHLVANEVHFDHHTNDAVVGDFGGGLEYRFTPHLGLFSDVRFNLVDGPRNNYLSTRFGLRYAF